MTIKVPGKLMMAGEFAVLQPNNHLVVMAVDRYVFTTIQLKDTNKISLMDFQLTNLSWKYSDGKAVIASDDPRTRFVEEAMTIAITYLNEKQISPAPFQLTINSELDDESGVKYGLGSSAAVVTSVIAAILKQFLPFDPTAQLIFKLASISHVITQGNGSGADVAASSYGGFLEYSSFQAEWLRKAHKDAKSLTELLQCDWIYFSLEPVQLPKNVYMCIGWTGSPASTPKLVDKILQLKSDNLTQFNHFLSESEKAVSKILTGMKQNNVESLFDGVKQNRHALATVGQHAKIAIETPLLSKLCDLAEACGGAGKPSGAGGGDCGIAFMPSQEQAQQLMEMWEKAGIKPLSLNPSPFGAKIAES